MHLQTDTNFLPNHYVKNEKKLDYLAELIYSSMLKIFHHEQVSEQAKRKCRKDRQFQQHLLPPLITLNGTTYHIIQGITIVNYTEQ